MLLHIAHNLSLGWSFLIMVSDNEWQIIQNNFAILHHEEWLIESQPNLWTTMYMYSKDTLHGVNCALPPLYPLIPKPIAFRPLSPILTGRREDNSRRVIT